MKCKYCQAELEDGVSVCPVCGKELEPVEVTEEANVPAEEAAAQVAEVEPIAAEEVTAEETADEQIPETENAEDETSEAKDTDEETAEKEAAEEEATEEEAVEDSEEETAEQTDEEQETAAEDTEIKDGAKMTSGKLALFIGGAVVLLAILIALVVSGMGGKESPDTTDGTTVSGETLPEETTPATIPADGNPDDVTCKGSYTVSDDEIIAAADEVVATLDNLTLTNADLQVYYWMEVANFLNQYGSYAAYFGMDYTQPLDTQICEDGRETPVTWQQYFLEMALDNWACYQALALEADEAGYQMDESYVSYLENIPEQLESSAVSNGYTSAQDLLHTNVGAGADMDDYIRYMELYYKGYTYFNSLYEMIQPTDEEIEAYFDENQESYTEQGVSKEEGKYVDVRHVLLMPEDENSTTGEDGYPVYSDEAWEACRVKAEELYEQWRSGDMTEESFAQLAIDNSADGSASKGGLYTDVTEGYMVETFNDWCFDETRKAGDHGLVKTQYGYHIMYFVDSRDIWFAKAKEDLISEQASEFIPAATEKHPATFDYSAIKLGLVDLTAE